MTVLLDIRDLAVRFDTAEGEVTALNRLSFEVRKGETVGLIGESGSGKTTAGKAILGLLPGTARVGGAVEFQGRDLLRAPANELRKLRWEEISLVPQAAMNSLDPVWPVDRQIAEAVRAHRRIDRATAREMAHEGLERVGIPRDRAGGYPHQFSGGMRQRALIAMALILQPTLLIADEPTTGLDVVVQDRIMELLASAKQQLDLSMIVVTHDLGVAAEICDRVIVLRHGEVLEAGPVDEVFSRPRHSYTRKLLGTRKRRSPADETPDRTSGEAAIAIENLAVSYTTGRGLAALRSSRSVVAVDDVSLAVDRGEVVGLAGESGCGKSSLASVLVGLTPISGGSVRINGTRFDGRTDTAWRDLRSQVQLIFQDPYQSLNPRFTVERTVAEPLIAQRLVPTEQIASRVRWALEAAELKPVATYLRRRPHELSGGERQRVAIARALVVEPQVLVADEPVSMLDHSIGLEIADLLRRLADDLGVAVLLVSHDLSLLHRVCDRVGVMYLGRLVETGPTDDVLSRPRHPYTRALIDAVPSRDPTVRRPRVLLAGEPPSAVDRPEGCPFHPRCARASDQRCSTVMPPLAGDRQRFACWHPHEVPLASPTAPRT